MEEGKEQRIFIEKTFGHEVILDFLKEKKADFIMFADWFNLAQDVSEKEKIIFEPLFEESDSSMYRTEITFLSSRNPDN